MIINKRIKFRHQAGRIHPLMATAAVAVTLFSLVGVAAITGVLPTSHGTPAAATAMNPTPLMATPNEPASNVVAMPAQNYVATPVAAYPAAPAPAPNYAPGPAPASAPAPAPLYMPPPAATHASPHHVVSAPQYGEPYPAEVTQVAQGPAICHSCGRVESVVAINEPAKPSGLGIAAGAVLGGVLGNHVGSGNGRTLATVAGAVAGGYGGNEVERRTRSTTTYQVRVRMEDGHVRTFPQSSRDGWRVGDRVRVVNGALTSRG